MTDISCINDDSTVAEVDRRLEKIGRKEKPRDYLGMSEVGDECYRKLWFILHDRTTEKFSARTLRIFKAGHRIEADIIRDLELAGYKVSGRQKVFRDFQSKCTCSECPTLAEDPEPHNKWMFKGHSDGILEGILESKVPHVLEVKSCSEKNFKLFLKHGVKDHPVYGEKYYAQAQLYMGYSGIKRTLFIIENKNTSERIQFRVKYVAKDFKALKAKAKIIIEAKYPPPGISENPTWFKCKLCQYNDAKHCRREYEVKLNW